MGNELYNYGISAIKRAGEIKIPMLVMHGSNDKLTSFKGSEEFAKNAGDGCEFKPWPGMKHETHNETDNEQVLAYLVNWVDSVIK